MTRKTFLAILIILAVFVTACSNVPVDIKDDLNLNNKETSNLPKSGGELTIAATSVDFLDPTKVQSEKEKILSNLIFDSFIKIDNKGSIQPGIAESWEISNDGKTYTFYLRKDVQWHNGNKLTSRDVKATILKATQQKQQDINENKVVKMPEYTNIKDIKTIDSYTLEVSLYKSDADFLYKLNIGILPEEVIEKLKATEYNNILEPIGVGPYKVEEKSSDIVKLHKFENYFNEEPYIDIINIKIYPDVHSAKEAFDRKEIDVLHIEPNEWEIIENIDDTALHEFPSSYFEFVALNHRNDIFNDLNVKKAMQYAIDREKLLQEAVMGRGIVIDTPILPTSWAYNSKLVTHQYNPSKARQLLKDAGWVMEDSSGVLEKNIGGRKQKLQFDLLVNMSNPSRYRAAMYIQKSLKDVGIFVELVNISWEELLDKVYKKDYDAAIMGWKLSENPDLSLMFSSNEIRKGNNFISYSNPELDEILLQIKTETSTSNRKKLLYKAQEIISSELPYLFLYSPNNLIAVSKNIKGFSHRGINFISNMYKWWID